MNRCVKKFILQKGPYYQINIKMLMELNGGDSVETKNLHVRQGRRGQDFFLRKNFVGSSIFPVLKTMKII